MFIGILGVPKPSQTRPQAHCPSTDTDCMATLELAPFKSNLAGHTFLS